MNVSFNDINNQNYMPKKIGIEEIQIGSDKLLDRIIGRLATLFMCKSMSIIQRVAPSEGRRLKLNNAISTKY